LDKLSGIDFERLIVDLLEHMGFDAKMTRTTGDGGIDIVAYLDKPIVGGRYLIQCKRFEAVIGAPVVREFYGALVADRKAVKGIFITTSGFTEQAREFASTLPLELIDRVRLDGCSVNSWLSTTCPGRFHRRTRGVLWIIDAFEQFAIEPNHRAGSVIDHHR
jgi:restriction endonuclease Mrr